MDVRKVTTTGKTGTYYVTLPKAMVKELGWRKGQKVTVSRQKDGIVIQDWEKGGLKKISVLRKNIATPHVKMQ